MCEVLRAGPPRLSAVVTVLIEACRGTLAAVAEHLATPCAAARPLLGGQIAAVGAAELALGAVVEAEPQALGRLRWVWLGSLTTDLLRIARELAATFAES